jgi:hypothetical protein
MHWLKEAARDWVFNKAFDCVWSVAWSRTPWARDESAALQKMTQEVTDLRENIVSLSDRAKEGHITILAWTPVQKITYWMEELSVHKERQEQRLVTEYAIFSGS